MAKVIYCLKIFLFRSLFELKETEVSNLEHFTLIIIRVYLKVWYTSTDASGVPLNDLNFLKDLNNCGNSSNGIYKLALKVFSGYLWYLSDELIGLAFFDYRVSDDIKLKMVKALDKNGTDNLEHRLKLSENLILNSELYNFATNNTYTFLTAINIEIEFLKTHPKTCKNNDEYLDECEKIKELIF
jgi:hypothetical protein